MKAWRVEKHGGPEALLLQEMSGPQPGPLQVRIRVEAVGLNHLDLWVRNGVPGHRFPLPLTPGCDIAGTLESFGAGSEDALSREGFRIGARVLVNPGHSCGRCEACLSGFDPLCRHYGIFGETRDGGCAEFVCAPIANLIAIPDEMSFHEAATLPIPFVTAWCMITRKAELRPGETILIHAGGSGVSVAAIQIAKLLGAHVITTVGSDEKATKARALGADQVILYKKTPFRNELKKRCDVVIDHVGADTFNDSLKSLAWGGRLVTCGATSGAEVSLDLKAIFFKNLSIFGSTMGSKADLIRIVDLVRQKKLKTVIDSVFPFAETPLAFERLESRQIFGKVILSSR